MQLASLKMMKLMPFEEKKNKFITGRNLVIIGFVIEMYDSHVTSIFQIKNIRFNQLYSFFITAEF